MVSPSSLEIPITSELCHFLDSNETTQEMVVIPTKCRIYLLGFYVAFNTVLYCIMTGSWKGRRNQYIQFIRVLYCKLPTNGKQLPTFPLEAAQGIKPWPQRWEARVLPLCHCGPPKNVLQLEFLCLGEHNVLILLTPQTKVKVLT